MIHSHKGWDYDVLRTKIQVNFIDMGAFVTHMDLIKSTPWTNFDAKADGKYAVAIAEKTTPVKATGVLVVHN